jgi:hypothetical protein
VKHLIHRCRRNQKRAQGQQHKRTEVELYGSLAADMYRETL